MSLVSSSNPYYLVPSAFQLTLYGFWLSRPILFTSIDTGCEPANPALEITQQIIYYYIVVVVVVVTIIIIVVLLLLLLYSKGE